jgi:hypothetical protein
VITLEPVGVVLGGRVEAIDDDWGAIDARIRTDAARFGPDAIDGSPVLDVKPYMREFEPAADDIRQPSWSTELMQGYY